MYSSDVCQAMVPRRCTIVHDSVRYGGLGRIWCVASAQDTANLYVHYTRQFLGGAMIVAFRVVVRQVLPAIAPLRSEMERL